MNVEAEGADAPQFETTLREDLAAALAEHSGGDEGGARAAEAVETPEHTGGDAGTTDMSPAKDGPARDASGKFAKAEGEAAAPAPAAAGDAAAPAADAAAAAPTDATAEPPASWGAEAKAKWGDLPPEVRAQIGAREKAISSLVGRADNERRFGKEIADIVRPHADTIKGFGVTPQFAIGVLLNNDRVMRTGTQEQKIAMARGFIRDYGLDPRQLIDPNAPTDPRVAAIMRENEQLKARQQVPQTFDHAPLPDTEQNAIVHDDIAAFQADPAHPHFQAVAPKMVALLESGQAKDLADAYDQAVWATPTLRSTLQAHQPQSLAPSEAQRQSPASKTAAARRASASVASSPGPAGSPAPMTLRDELRENLRKAGFGS